jgi:hypothetical protein
MFKKLINFLIIFFIILMGLQIFLANFGGNLVEGLENNSTNTATNTSDTSSQYQNYNDDDPLILSKKNAANIDFLKGRVDEVLGLKNQVNDISLNVSSLETQVNTILEQQAEYSKNVNGGEPIEVTGTEETEIVETSNEDVTEGFINMNPKQKLLDYSSY